jgi:hypothetical protein
MPTSPEEAMAVLAEGDAAVGALLAKLTDEQMDVPGSIGGGEWSAKDLLAHLAFWERLALEALDDWRGGRKPGVEAVFEGGAEGVDEANAGNHARWRSEPVSAVRAEAREVHERLARAIAAATDEWRAKAFYETARRQTLGELLGGVVGAPKRPFGHAFAHLPDLETYVGMLA